ncbi:MAG: ATP-binding protein [bacterium]
MASGKGRAGNDSSIATADLNLKKEFHLEAKSGKEIASEDQKSLFWIFNTKDINPAIASVLAVKGAGAFICREMLFLRIGKEILDLLGYDEKRLIGRLGPLEIVASEDWEKLYRYLTRDLRSDLRPYCFKFVRSDSTTLICQFAADYREINGETMLIGAISPWERKSIAQQDAKSIDLYTSQSQYENTKATDIEGFYPKVFVNLPDPAIIHNQSGQIIDANQAAVIMLGYSVDEIRKYRYDDIFKLDRESEIRPLDEQSTQCSRAKIIRADGSSVWVCLRSQPIFKDKITHSVTLFNDATMLRKNEEAFCQANLEKTLILNSIRELVAYQDKTHTIIWANKAAGESVREHPTELAGRKCYEIWHHKDTVCPGCPVDEALRDGCYHQNEVTTPDNRVWLIKANPVSNDKGEVIGAVEVTLEITDIKRAEQQQKQREADLRLQNKISSAFLANPDESAYQVVLDHIIETTASDGGILAYITDSRGLVIPASKGNLSEIKQEIESQPADELFENIFGKTCLSGEPIVSNSPTPEKRVLSEIKRWLLAPILEETKPIGFILLTDKPLDYTDLDTHLIERAAISIAPVLKTRLDRERQEKRAQKIKMEKEEIQRRLLIAQRMEAVGRLAGGIAHDFNNILSSIRGYCDLVMMRLDPDSIVYKDLRQIQDAIKRAAGLNRQLLLFSKQQPLEISSVNINSLVQGVSEMVSRLLGENISLTLSLDPNILSIRGDKSQIEQVILNLMLNARDAMPNGGTINVKTENYIAEDLKEKETTTCTKMVCLSVSDAGVGIPPDKIDHIFEPFYTTKKGNSGTGLGLSIVQSIVEKHGGWITVSSEVNNGATFKVYLPTNGEPADDDQPDTIDIVTMRGNRERILIVEDEEQIRDLLCRALRENNYTVFQAASADEAIKLFQDRKGEIDLLLSDVVLTDKSGVDLAERLLSLKSSLSIVMMSGYADGKCEWPRIQRLGFRFIHKPFGIADLLRSIRASLKSTRPEVI